MLKIVWPIFAEATINIVIVFAATIIPLDCPNNRARWPIPEADRIWECEHCFTRGRSAFVYFGMWMSEAGMRTFWRILVEV